LYGSQRLSDIFFASIDDTIVDDPNSFDACFIKFGSSRALELIATLSAPNFNAFSISDRDVIPPPKVIGIKISFVILLIKSNRLFLPYKLATLS